MLLTYETTDENDIERISPGFAEMVSAFNREL